MPHLTRRQALAATGTALVAASASPALGSNAKTTGPVPQGRLKQSVCRWPFNKIPLRDFFKSVADLGLTAVDLLNEEEWTIAKEYGLTCSMGWAGGGTIPDGLNDKANHDAIVEGLSQYIPKAAKAGIPNIISFFGNRRGRSDAEGIENCVVGLNRIKKVAEDHGVTVCVELLNSKVNHEDYHGDRTPFGVEVMKRVDSPRVRLLYDIYHMQIMEGDIIRTIRDNREYIAHYHTGGVPGRNELDDTQELQWRTIASAIVETGFDGYFAHEFIPTRDPMASLREAVALCAV
jgi:hydroxypyruvate isomerase